LTDLIWSLPDGVAAATVLLAHGAGAPMDAPFMNRLAEALAAEGLAVARFEFGYMAARRTSGKKTPPPEAGKLVGEYRAAIDAVLAAPEAAGRILIGGKSMGGRVAAMTAGAPLDPRVAGVACFGYPFHPPGRPVDLRLAPLVEIRLPTLVLQGERDEFGNRAEVEGFGLQPPVEVVFVEDGSHDFGPRGSSPATLKGNILFAAAETARFARALA
jgi:hypothetical protein